MRKETSGTYLFLWLLLLLLHFLFVCSAGWRRSHMDTTNVSYTLARLAARRRGPQKSLSEGTNDMLTIVSADLGFFSSSSSSSFLPLCPLLIYQHYHISSNCFGSLSLSLVFIYRLSYANPITELTSQASPRRTCRIDKAACFQPADQPKTTKHKQQTRKE